MPYIFHKENFRNELFPSDWKKIMYLHEICILKRRDVNLFQMYWLMLFNYKLKVSVNFVMKMHKKDEEVILIYGEHTFVHIVMNSIEAKVKQNKQSCFQLTFYFGMHVDIGY